MKRKEFLALVLISLMVILIVGCTPPVIQWPPDLEVIDISCVSPEGILSFTVKNSGFGEMPDNWQTGPKVVAQISSYYAEFDQDFPLGQVDLNEAAVSSSGGGIDQPDGTSTYHTDIIIGIDESSLPVKVIVDYSDEIIESNEENNTTLQAFTPCGRGVLPDLVVNYLWIYYFDTALIPGVDDFDQLIHLAVKNLGKVVAYGTENHPNQGYIIDFVLSSDENIPANPTVFEYAGQLFSISLPTSYWYYQEDMMIGRISSTEDIEGDGEVGYILARYLGGEVIELPHEFPTVEWEGPRRTFYLFAIIDPLYRVEEAMEDNNIFYIPVEIERPLNY